MCGCNKLAVDHEAISLVFIIAYFLPVIVLCLLNCMFDVFVTLILRLKIDYGGLYYRKRCLNDKYQPEHFSHLNILRKLASFIGQNFSFEVHR